MSWSVRAPIYVAPLHNMGMNPFQIHRLIIFPQAVQNIFGVYKTQVVNLIKATSVVGYIAVQDLTKARTSSGPGPMKPFSPWSLQP